MSTDRGLLLQLTGGDRRSVRGVAQVVQQVEANPRLFPALFTGLGHADGLVRMRAADAVEKLSVSHPEYLDPFKAQLLQLAARAEEKEVRWHMAQLLPRLALNARERKRALQVLDAYLSDESKIVKTFAMQALVDFACVDPKLRAPVLARIQELTQTGSPAMQSRGRKLLARLAKLE